MKYTARHEFVFLVDAKKARSVELAAARISGELAARRSVRDVYFGTASTSAEAVSSKLKSSEYRVRHKIGLASLLVQQHTRESSQSKLRETVVKPSANDTRALGPDGVGSLLPASREALAVSGLLCNPKQSPLSAQWFCKKIKKRKIAPAIELAFDRYSYHWGSNENTQRLTIDRELVGRRLCDPASTGVPMPGTLLPTSMICMRFSGVMPVEFKRLAVEFGLCPTATTAFAECRRQLPTAVAERESAGAVNASDCRASVTATATPSVEGFSCLTS